MARCSYAACPAIPQSREACRRLRTGHGLFAAETEFPDRHTGTLLAEPRLEHLDVHSVADTAHSDSMSQVYERYVKTDEDCELVLKGARESMAIDRAFRGALAYYMERIE